MLLLLSSRLYLPLYTHPQHHISQRIKKQHTNLQKLYSTPTSSPLYITTPTRPIKPYTSLHDPSKPSCPTFHPPSSKPQTSHIVSTYGTTIPTQLRTNPIHYIIQSSQSHHFSSKSLSFLKPPTQNTRLYTKALSLREICVLISQAGCFVRKGGG